MSIVEKMENDPIIEQESDFELCVCSVSELYLKYIYDENRVTHLIAYLDSESRIEEGVVKAAEFQLGESGVVFLDPFNLFGIRIGTEQQRDEWLRTRSDTTNITREVFLVEGSRA
jgi:hypothetical protein